MTLQLICCRVGYFKFANTIYIFRRTCFVIDRTVILLKLLAVTDIHHPLGGQLAGHAWTTNDERQFRPFQNPQHLRRIRSVRLCMTRSKSI